MQEKEDTLPGMVIQIGFKPSSLFFCLGERPIHDLGVQEYTVYPLPVKAVPRAPKLVMPFCQ